MRSSAIALVSLLAASAQAGAVRLPPTRWSREKQAVHLLNRLAYGPSPQDLARVEAEGPAAWIAEQLEPAQIDDSAVDAKLAPFHTLRASTVELIAQYPPLMQVAKREGIDLQKPGARQMLQAQMPLTARPIYVMQELAGARLVRAIESRRQLEEVLVDFWFNHFNVSADKGPERWMLTAYERDTIRPHLFGTFRELLGAVAHDPAMLFYLDNWLSTREGFSPPRMWRLTEQQRAKLPSGLNENYGRELMELHTLGVDGGYTQADVREVARCFTGWSIQKPRQGGGFVFRPRVHDDGAKHVLGLTVLAGGGEEDGEAVLDYLARAPQTAHHLAYQLCQKFVADQPPAALVDRVAKVFLDTGGDLRQVYLAIFTSPEFWSDAAFEAKTKTPLEYAVSAVRALGGQSSGDFPLYRQIARMGEPLYRYQAPTGYPEIATPWVNAGALVSRINFGLALASERVGGTDVDLSFVPANARPEHALDLLAARILHHPPSRATRKALLAAIAPQRDTLPEDGERPPLDVPKLAGLLLGSPEFQKQ